MIRSALRGILVAFGLAAVPAAAQITISYAPRSAIDLSGHVEVDTFAFIPAKPSHKLNEIPNTAIGSIKLDKDIGAFMADAVRQELRTSGVSILAGARCRLSGEVRRVHIDDLGFDADYVLAVSYALKGQDGATLFETAQDTSLKSTKVNGAQTIALMFARNINDVLENESFISALEKNCPRGVNL